MTGASWHGAVGARAVGDVVVIKGTEAEAKAPASYSRGAAAAVRARSTMDASRDESMPCLNAT